MHIGVVPDLSFEDGGVRQYSLSVLHALRAFANEWPALKITVVLPEDERSQVTSYIGASWSTLPPEPAWRVRITKDPSCSKKKTSRAFCSSTQAPTMRIACS